MNKHKWIRNPFVDNAITSKGFISLEAKQIIDLLSDLIMKSKYSSDLLTFFWIKAQFKFPLVHGKALHILILLATLHLGEASFSEVAVISLNITIKLTSSMKYKMHIEP